MRCGAVTQLTGRARMLCCAGLRAPKNQEGFLAALGMTMMWVGGVTMRAIVIPRHGGPEVLELQDVARPEPGPGEVLVRVRACALNHLDLWSRGGIPGIQFPLPLIPGSDIAGEIAALGVGATRV